MSDDSRPASLQVADALRREIATGALAAGEKIPSVRKIAETFKVAPMTAQNAVEILKNEGLVYSSPGRGTFVRSQLPVSASSPSPEFAAITEHLEELGAQVRNVTERVTELEKLVRHERQSPR
jgi:GntR family transcriptional regulator